MAISEITKQAVAQIKGVYQSRIDQINLDINEHQNTISKLQSEKADIKTKLDALKADIAEPTVINPINS